MLHSVQSFFYFSPKCLFSVRLDSLICFADREEGEEDWYVRGDIRFMNFTTFCYLIFYLLFFLENFFFTHDIYPLPRPTPIPTTHDPRQRITPSPDQPSRASPDQTQSSQSRSTQSCQFWSNPVQQFLIKPSPTRRDQPSLASPDHPSLASPDQTQSSKFSSNPVEPVQINPV